MFLSRIRKIIAAPIFEDEEKTRLANLLNTTLLATIFTNVVFTLLLPLMFENPLPNAIPNTVFLLVQITLLYLNKNGQVRLTGKLLLFSVWLLLTYLLYYGGGLREPTFSGYILLILMAGLALGKRAGLIAAIFTTLSSFLLAFIELNGYLPTPIIQITPLYTWMGMLIILIITAVLLYLIIQNIESSLEKTRVSENLHRTLVESLDLGLCRWKPDTTLTYYNEKYKNLFGIENEVNGKKWLDFVPIESQAKTAAFYQQLSKNPKTSSSEHTIALEDGSRRYFKWLDTPIQIENGEATHFQSVGIDITELKEAENAIRKSEARLKEAQKIAQMGNWSWNIATGEIHWSDEMYAIYGLPHGNVPEIPKVRELILEEDVAIFDQAMQEVGQGGIADSIEYRIKLKDGRIRYLLARAKAILDDAGNLQRLTGTVQDITERKELEEQLQLSQKMEAVGQLTAGIAHDFNNLLTAINGSAELLQLKLSPDDPLKRLADRIVNSGDYAANLISQLMAFSRKQIIEPKILDLNDSVRQINSILNRTIGDHIILKTNLAKNLWSIKIDPTQIKQLVVNLAVNARDAMPDGGELHLETININILDSNIDQHLQVPFGEYVLLSVRDTGIGIGQEARARIFEPFYTTKAVGQGTGLGLATVYAIVTQNNGAIRVHSEEGNGATFKIYLPKAQQISKQPVLINTAVAMPKGNETILVVEDSDEVRELAIDVLQMQGYTILEARGGVEAIEIVKNYSEKIDLLLTDVIMPNMNGKQLVEHLSRTDPNLKTLFMSGYSDEVIAKHGILDSNIAFLQKPFTLAQLTDKIQQVLDRKTDRELGDSS